MLVCLLGNLDHQDEVQLGGEDVGVGEVFGVLHVLELVLGSGGEVGVLHVEVEEGDGGPVHHALVQVGRGGVLGDLVLVRVGIHHKWQIFF